RGQRGRDGSAEGQARPLRVAGARGLGRPLERERRQPLARHGIGHRVLERPRGLPLVGRAYLTRRADLIDAPVDLEIVAVRVAKLHGELAAGAPSAFENDRDVVLAQPGASAKHLVRRADLERKVIQRGALELGRAADERDAMVVRVEAEKDHPAGHHAVGIAVADRKAEHVRVEAHRRLEVGDVEDHVAELAQLEHIDLLARQARVDRTGACARTRLPSGESSRWKNATMLPAAMRKASSGGTPANNRSANGRVFGQSHSMCGKSVANMMPSTPIPWPTSTATRSTSCTLNEICRPT